MMLAAVAMSLGPAAGILIYWAANWKNSDVEKFIFKKSSTVDAFECHSDGMNWNEQFHSEIKTDLDLERLPSGKFDTNYVVCELAALAMNILRLLGQAGLHGPDAPVRQEPRAHAAVRRLHQRLQRRQRAHRVDARDKAPPERLH